MYESGKCLICYVLHHKLTWNCHLYSFELALFKGTRVIPNVAF